jgi:hypothetical protein
VLPTITPNLDRPEPAADLPGRCTMCGDPLAWTGEPGSNRIHAWSGPLGLPDRPYDHPAQPNTQKAVN